VSPTLGGLFEAGGYPQTPTKGASPPWHPPIGFTLGLRLRQLSILTGRCREPRFPSGGSGDVPLKSFSLPLLRLRGGLNTMGSYMYSLAQKSTNTNWLARRSHWHDFTDGSDVCECFSHPEEPATNPLSSTKGDFPTLRLRSVFRTLG